MWRTRLTRGAGPALAAFSERCAIPLPPQSLRTLSWTWYAQHRQLVWVQIGLCYYTAVLLQRHARVDAAKVWTPKTRKDRHVASSKFATGIPHATETGLEPPEKAETIRQIDSPDARFMITTYLLLTD